MPKVSQELLGFRISNFEPKSKICQKFTEFILFGKVTSCGKNAGLFQKVTQCYVIIVVDFEVHCLIWFTIFVKVDRIENFKMETCCTECKELGNVIF